MNLYRALSWMLPALALLVIVFGAYVRLSDAGLGCPDWPGCYGRLSVPQDVADVHLQQPDWATRPLEAGKAWREMIHRYLASALGLGIVVLAWMAWRRPHPRATRVAAFWLVPLVVFQGMLGMWTVTLLLKPAIVCAHLLGGLTTLALLWWNFLNVETAAQARNSQKGLHAMAWVGLGMLAVQIFLGGWTSANYAALACTDIPTCHGQWWPKADFEEAFILWRGLGVNYEFGVLDTPARTAIHLTHRIGAAATTIVIACLIWGAQRSVDPSLRRLGWCILGALAAQITLGITNVLAGLPLVPAIAHNAGAAVLLMSVLTLLHATRGTLKDTISDDF
jgi:heme a synthase